MIDYGLVLSIINDSDDPITAFETFVKQEVEVAYQRGLSQGRSERDDAADAIKAAVWDEAVDEVWSNGWLHDWAKADSLDRNPYRGGDQ